jgi:hypothetical protein
MKLIYIYTYTHTHIRTYTHIHIHTYTHIHIRTYLCIDFTLFIKSIISFEGKSYTIDTTTTTTTILLYYYTTILIYYYYYYYYTFIYTPEYAHIHIYSVEGDGNVLDDLMVWIEYTYIHTYIN